MMGPEVLMRMGLEMEWRREEELHSPQGGQGDSALGLEVEVEVEEGVVP